jgi:L-aspartate oxidase
VYWETTNPNVATGDGMAMAYRAGAQLADMEMVQFHPTALFTEGAPRFLLSEALRGEGARLLNAAGEPFMHNYDERGDLAPRDIVSRAIVAELRRTQSGPAYLDLTHLDAEKIPKRFPRIYETCLLYGIDITLKPVPVHPAAHYAMGGVHTDLAGRTTIPRLYAAGEVACTGVHGANRLASNSLLEGLVFGARAGAAMREFAGSAVASSAIPDRGDPAPLPANSVFDLRRLAWRRAGIERFADSLNEGMTELERMSPLFPRGVMRNNRQGFEADNIYLLVSLIIQSALAREESRGAHYRSDFPEPRPEFCRHSLVTSGGPVGFSDLAEQRVAQ